MALLANLDERVALRDPYLQTLVPEPTAPVPYGNDAAPTPTSPTAPRNIPYGPDATPTPIPKTPTPTTPPPTTSTIKPIQQFNQLLYASTTIPNDLKIQISNLAKTAYQGEYNAKEIETLHKAIFSSALPQELKLQLAKLIDYQKRTTPPAPTGGGTGTGGGGGGAHGGTGGGTGGLSVSGDVGAYEGDLANQSLGWAEKILGGNFSNLPLFQELTDPKYSDPTTNPFIQSMVDNLQREMQEDWLGNVTALTEQSEAAGRYGSGLYQALRTRATEESQEALASAIANMYSGAYENERQRRAGLLPQFLSAQTSASRIPIEVGQLGVQQAQLGINKGYLSLSKDQFAFQKKMGLLGAQQSAIMDYLNLLLGIGGLGGTQVNQGGGQFVPTMNPNTAAILGGLSGLGTGINFNQYWNNRGSGSTTPGVQ